MWVCQRMLSARVHYTLSAYCARTVRQTLFVFVTLLSPQTECSPTPDRNFKRFSFENVFAHFVCCFRRWRAIGRDGRSSSSLPPPPPASSSWHARSSSSSLCHRAKLALSENSYSIPTFPISSAGHSFSSARFYPSPSIRLNNLPSSTFALS